MPGRLSETRSTILQDLQDSVTAIEVALTELRQAVKTRQESLEASKRFDQQSHLINAGRKACADLKYFWNNISQFSVDDNPRYLRLMLIEVSQEAPCEHAC
jgi:hypothetical protein